MQFKDIRGIYIFKIPKRFYFFIVYNFIFGIEPSYTFTLIQLPYAVFSIFILE